RVAEASAASSASKMISLSTPFSLETASTTIRISLFIVQAPAVFRSRAAGSNLWRQPRLLYGIEAQAHRPVLHFQGDRTLRYSGQPSGEALAAVDLFAQLRLHPLAHETLEVLLRPQHPIQPRRGHLQGVVAGDGIGLVQLLADCATDLCAVFHRNAVGGVD